MPALTMHEAAAWCGVDRRTILRWVKSGILPSHRTGGGQHRVSRTALAAFMRERGMPLPSPERATVGPTEIAVVDDEPLVVTALSAILRRLVPGCVVRSASDGFGAGILLAEHRPSLLFLDLAMPGLDGYAVVRWLAERPEHRTTRVVVHSAHLDDAAILALRALGVTTFLRKPAPIAQIEEIVADYRPTGVAR